MEPYIQAKPKGKEGNIVDLVNCLTVHIFEQAVRDSMALMLII